MHRTRHSHERPRGRVVHVISSFDGGGAERVLLTVLTSLRGYVHTLALAGRGTLLPLVPRRVRVTRAGTTPQLARLLASSRPDVVHTWLDDSLLLAMPAAAHLGIPVVHRLYNVPSVQKVYEPGGPGHNQQMARALRAASAVVSLSATAADDAVTFYGIARPTVIHNGFPLAGARGVGEPEPTLPGSFVLLNVARFAPQKGHGVLLDAFAPIAARHPHVELWLAGIGAPEAALRAQASRLGIASHVRFLGFREDVTALHASADAFVFPSVFEGFGNALVEAMMAGLPIVASDLEVIRRDVFGGHPAGLLVPPGDVSALARALDRVVTDAPLRARLGQAARAAAAPFDVHRMLDAYGRLYASVGGTHHAAA